MGTSQWGRWDGLRVACVAGRNKGGKSKWARKGEGPLPRSSHVRSSAALRARLFPFSPVWTPATQARLWVSSHLSGTEVTRKVGQFSRSATLSTRPLFVYSRVPILNNKPGSTSPATIARSGAMGLQRTTQVVQSTVNNNRTTLCKQKSPLNRMVLTTCFQLILMSCFSTWCLQCDEKGIPKVWEQK